MIVYLDDVLIYFDDYQSHLMLVRKVFKALYQNKLFPKLSKCDFEITEFDFLGHWISEERLIMYLRTMQDVVAQETPRTKHKLQSFY